MKDKEYVKWYLSVNWFSFSFNFSKCYKIQIQNSNIFNFINNNF